MRLPQGVEGGAVVAQVQVTETSDGISAAMLDASKRELIASMDVSHDNIAVGSGGVPNSVLSVGVSVNEGVVAKLVYPTSLAVRSLNTVSKSAMKAFDRPVCKMA